MFVFDLLLSVKSWWLFNNQGSVLETPRLCYSVY